MDIPTRSAWVQDASVRRKKQTEELFHQYSRFHPVTEEGGPSQAEPSEEDSETDVKADAPVTAKKHLTKSDHTVSDGLVFH